jgi:hypothetical protein
LADLREEILMRELINDLMRMQEALSKDDQEVADISKKHGFGSIAWQDAMLDRLRRKVQNKETLTGSDMAFIQTQVMHNKALHDEFEHLGLDKMSMN